VLTPAIVGQGMKFASEQDFYRYAERHLRPYFPTLPHRSQDRRLLRRSRPPSPSSPSTWLTNSGVARWRRMCSTWSPPQSAMPSARGGAGWSESPISASACGWGGSPACALTAVSLEGVITAWGSPRQHQRMPLAETLIAVWAQPDPRLPSVGTPVVTYLADSGFVAQDFETHLAATYGVTLVAPPQRGSRRRWSTAMRRWVARHRQIVETVIGRLRRTFGLERERPHTLAGFQALRARVALHNLCCWFNREDGRPLLAVADLIAW